MGRKYSQVEKYVWRDPGFRSMDLTTQHLWLYLLTCPHSSNLPGLICTSRAVIADEMGRDLETEIDPAMACLEAMGWLKYDPETRVVYLPNALEHNPPRSENELKGWLRDLGEIPDTSFKIEWTSALTGMIDIKPIGVSIQILESIRRVFGPPSKGIRTPFEPPCPPNPIPDPDPIPVPPCVDPPREAIRSEDIASPVAYILEAFPQLDQLNAEAIWMNNKRTHPDMGSREWTAIVNDAVAKSEVNKPVRDIPRQVAFSASDYYKARRIEAERSHRFQGPTPPPQTIKEFEPDEEIVRTPEEQAECARLAKEFSATLRGAVQACTLPDGGGESVHTYRAVHGSVNAPVAEATPEQLAELERMRDRARQKAETLEDNTRLTRASAEGVL